MRGSLNMWNYIRQYLVTAVIAGLFMVGEVLMDLVQPGIMSRIVDDGVLGVNSAGTPDLHLVWMLGLQMIGLVLFGGLCGSLNALRSRSTRNIPAPRSGVLSPVL